jgi:hypothetical protein
MVMWPASTVLAGLSWIEQRPDARHQALAGTLPRYRTGAFGSRGTGLAGVSETGINGCQGRRQQWVAFVEYQARGIIFADGGRLFCFLLACRYLGDGRFDLGARRAGVAGQRHVQRLHETEAIVELCLAPVVLGFGGEWQHGQRGQQGKFYEPLFGCSEERHENTFGLD